MKGNIASRMEFVFFLTGNVTARREKAGESIDDDFREAEMRARRRRRKKNWRARKRKRDRRRGCVKRVEELRTRWRHIVEQREDQKKEGVGGVGGFQSNPPFPSPRKFSDVREGEEGREGQIGGESNAIRMRVTQAIRECRDVTRKGGRDESFMKFRLYRIYRGSGGNLFEFAD